MKNLTVSQPISKCTPYCVSLTPRSGPTLLQRILINHPFPCKNSVKCTSISTARSLSSFGLQLWADLLGYHCRQDRWCAAWSYWSLLTSSSVSRHQSSQDITTCYGTYDIVTYLETKKAHNKNCPNTLRKSHCQLPVFNISSF